MRRAIRRPAAVRRRIEIVDQPELEDHCKSFDTVFPADLLALFIRAPVVADGHFVDAQLALGALHHNLRLKAEAVRTDGDAFEQVSAENLVTGFHVRQVEIAEHVGNHREPLVDHGVPEGQHARLIAGEVARAEDRVGVPIQQWTQQAGIFTGVVFQVGVLDQRKIARGLLNSGADRGAFPAIVRVLVELNLRKRGGQALQDGESAVGGTIVHDDQFPLHIFGQGSGEDERDATLHNGTLVVDRHQDGKLHL